MDIFRTVATFVWFLQQCITVGGLGILWFAVPFVLLCATLVFLFLKMPNEARLRLPVLLTLPVLWMFEGFWGAYFWLEWQNPKAHNPPWTEWIPQYGFWTFLAVALLLLVYLRGSRIFAALFTLMNGYFMLGMSFLSGMAVTGAWL